MSGKKGRSGGHNKKAVTWNGKHYESRKHFEESHGLGRGYIGYYLRESRPFKDHIIEYNGCKRFVKDCTKVEL